MANDQNQALAELIRILQENPGILQQLLGQIQPPTDPLGQAPGFQHTTQPPPPGVEAPQSLMGTLPGYQQPTGGAPWVHRLSPPAPDPRPTILHNTMLFATKAAKALAEAGKNKGKDKGGGAIGGTE